MRGALFICAEGWYNNSVLSVEGRLWQRNYAAAIRLVRVLQLA